MLGYRERRRREHQSESVIAARAAYYGALALCGNGKPLPEVYELFPFWTEEEIKACKVEKYRAIMMRHAAGHIGRGGEQSSQP